MSARKARRETVLKKAVQVFGNEKEAKRWMREPAIGLNQQVPAELVSTVEGAELVSTYLDQIEYCVFV
jgi:putative toxin-antitoxin system antitoxin component (TIGR02293 family)